MRNERSFGWPSRAAGVNQHRTFVGFSLHGGEGTLLRGNRTGVVHIHTQHVGGVTQVHPNDFAQCGALRAHSQHIAD